MATALSAMPNINTLVDYTLVYKTKKRDVWSFAKGDMKHAKVLVTKYKIPEYLKNRNYANDQDYRNINITSKILANYIGQLGIGRVKLKNWQFDKQTWKKIINTVLLM